MQPAGCGGGPDHPSGLSGSRCGAAEAEHAAGQQYLVKGVTTIFGESWFEAMSHLCYALIHARSSPSRPLLDPSCCKLYLVWCTHSFIDLKE